MVQQINPPFDGSSPCPMCNQEVRGISALIHNFLVRWPEQKALVKLNDIREFWKRPAELAVENPVVTELLDVADALVAACSDMTREHTMIRWTPETKTRIAEIVPRAEAVMAALEPLSDAHWHDDRHCYGEENSLRESQGVHGISFLRQYSYHHKVEVVTDDPDLLHQPCNTGLKIDQHFKDNMAVDPKFYGRVWCPTCRLNAPFAQYTCR